MSAAKPLPGQLFIDARLALKMFQREFADLLGVERRTVQRWEDDGALVPTETIVTLAAALDGVRPDLAAQCRAIASQDPEMPTDPEAITRILEAAAKAAGTSADAVRPAVEAAFREARAVGASVHGVVLALMPGALPSTNQA